MLNFIENKPMNIVIIEDRFVAAEAFEEGLASSKVNVGTIKKVSWGPTSQEEWAKKQLNIERNGSEAEPGPEGIDEILAECDLLCVHFCPVSRAMIEKATNLKAILTCRGGLEHINVEAATERNIPVINCIRNAIPVAEFTIGLMISATRNMATSHHDMMQGKWNKDFLNDGSTYTIMNQIVGLVGLGNVGVEMAIRLKAFGCRIIAWDPYADMKRLEANGIADVIEFKDTLEDVFREADIVSLHLRLVPQTEKLIDKKFFALMKPTAYFINGARGGLINQDDLAEALRERKIMGAALDVFDSEPLRSNSGLTELPNVTITPHIAGKTEEAIPKSPLMLFKEVDGILEKNLTTRIVNYNRITL